MTTDRYITISNRPINAAHFVGVGGIGVSGVKASDDEIVAQAGLDALREALG